MFLSSLLLHKFLCQLPHHYCKTAHFSQPVCVALQVKSTAVSTTDYCALYCVMLDIRLRLVEDTIEVQKVRLNLRPHMPFFLFLFVFLCLCIGSIVSFDQLNHHVRQINLMTFVECRSLGNSSCVTSDIRACSSCVSGSLSPQATASRLIWE